VLLSYPLSDERSRVSQEGILDKRPLPPLIGWHQRKKSVLRGELIRVGRSTRVDFETADVPRAVALMRLFVRHELDNGRLRPGSRAVRLYGPDAPWKYGRTSPIGDAKFRSEIRRLRGSSALKYHAVREAESGRLQLPLGLLDRLAAKHEIFLGRRHIAPPFMSWGPGPAGKRVLESSVQLIDGWLGRRLNTDDPERAGHVLRLLLWHAIERGKLKEGIEHPAWIAYGGPIARATKCLLQRLTELPWGEYELERKPMAARLGVHVTVLDFLTDHEKPATVVAATCRRSRGRRRQGKHTPMSRSWQFRRIGRMVHSHRQCFYGRVMIGYRTFSWRLAVSNRADAEQLVKSALDARRRVREAAWHWREYPTEAAMKAVLAAQLQYCQALKRTGADRCKDWGDLQEFLRVGPSDEATEIDQARTWFIALLNGYPKYPPRPVEKLIQQAMEKFKLSKPKARQAYREAQNTTGNFNWSENRRPSKNILQARAEQPKLEKAPLI
jgi:hypothetical protein